MSNAPTSRAIPISKLYNRKYKDLVLGDVWKDVLDVPELGGIWLVWGNEKHGKTWFCLKLAEHLSQNNKVLYISAEEGLRKTFKEACERANLDPSNKKLMFEEYIKLPSLKEKLSKRRSPDIVFIDNITIYQDELKYGGLRSLEQEFPNKLFIFLAHEDRGAPYTSTAKLARRLATAIMYVAGLKCEVSGRVPGGTLIIDEQKAKIFHGNNI